MGFTSVDDLIAEITAGKTLKMPYQKTSNNAAALVAGYWAETLQWAGTPPAATLSGTPGTAEALNDSRTGSWYHGGNVDPDTKHILNLLKATPTTTICPATVLLVDFLVMYPSLVVTGAPTGLTPTALPRYTDGNGVKAIVSVISALGATTPTLTFTYKDNLDQNRVAGGHSAPGASAPLSSLFVTDGVPFIREATGFRGMKTLESYTLATGTTGTVSAFLIKPLATIPLLALNTPTERDYVYQLPSLPQIKDGACLGFLVNVGGAMIASAKHFGLMDVAWG